MKVYILLSLFAALIAVAAMSIAIKRLHQHSPSPRFPVDEIGWQLVVMEPSQNWHTGQWEIYFNNVPTNSVLPNRLAFAQISNFRQRDICVGQRVYVLRSRGCNENGDPVYFATHSQRQVP